MFQILLETAPYRQWIIITPRVPSPTVLVPYTVVKYEYSYRKVLYVCTYRTTVLNLLRYLQYGTVLRFPLRVLTTYYLQYYLLPTSCYYLIPTTRLLPTVLPPAYCLLPITCYLLPTTYYLLPTTSRLLPTVLPTTYYLLPTTCYLLPILPPVYSTAYYLLPAT